MSIVLKVSTERINASASTVEGELSKVRASFDDLDGIMNRMSSYWEGEGANHYRSVYTKYKDDMLAWLENIPYTIDHEKREGFHLGYKAALEKQGTSYTKSDVDDAYLKGISDAKHELEKQGGEKPADKAEPKFKVGDWITNGDCTWKIVEVKPLDYILRTPYGNIVDDTISFVDEQFHSLTIEDAKDDDKIKPKFIKNFKNYIKEE